MSEIAVKTAQDTAGARAAAQCVVETHRRLSQFLRMGQTLAQIDKFVEDTLADLKCTSAFFGYKVGGHPPFMSHACLSINECVVHGTRAYVTRPLEAGDVLKIDIGVKHVAPGEREPWVGDAAWTYCFGEPSATVAKLMAAGKESLAVGIPHLRPGARYLDWAVAVEDCVETKYGLKCIEHWGGHGYGRSLHGPPHILNHRPDPPESWPEARQTWRVGQLVAVEPMIAVATRETFQRPAGDPKRKMRDWPVYVAERAGGRTLKPEERMSVHYEHDVLIGPEGPIVLTEGLESIADVIMR